MRNLDEYLEKIKDKDIKNHYNNDFIIADNTLTPEELGELAKHKNPYIRSAVAQHKNTSTETRLKLSGDDLYLVSTPANAALESSFFTENLHQNTSYNKTPITINDPQKGIATDLDTARAPETTAEVLDRLAILNIGLGSKNADIGIAIAQHKNASAQTVEMLSKNKRWEVRLATTSHPKLPFKALKVLTKDEDINVREAAGYHLALRNKRSLWGRVKKVAKGAKKVGIFIGAPFSLQGKVPAIVGDVINIANRLIEAAKKRIQQYKENKDLSKRKEWTPELAAKAVKKNGNNLKFVPEDFATKEICMLAVANKGEALQFAPSNVKDKDICDKAMEQNTKEAFAFVPDDLKTPTMCDNAITADANNLKYVPEKSKDETLCIKAVKMCGKTLDFVPQDLRHHDMCTLAVKNDGESLKFVPDDLRTQAICKLAQLNTHVDISAHIPPPKEIEPSAMLKQLFLQSQNKIAEQQQQRIQTGTKMAIA